MNLRLGCAVCVFGVLCFDYSNAGALKKYFSKNDNVTEQNTVEDVASQKHIENENAVSETESKTSTSGSEKTMEASDVGGDGASSVTASVEKKKIVGDPVVLRINGKKEFRRSHILAEMRKIPPQMLQGIEPDKLFEMLREQVLNTYLMVEQAKKAGMDRSKEFLERVAQLKDELLGRMFMMKELAPKAENESALKARYTKYLVEFKKGKEIKLRHILLDTEAEAKEVIVSLDKGSDFAALATEKSKAPSRAKAGEEGYVPVDMMPAVVKDKISSLKSGEYNKEPIKTDNGYHVFKAEDIRDTSPMKFEEAKPMLKQVLVHEEMMHLFDRLSKQANVEKFNEDGSAIVAPSK